MAYHEHGLIRSGPWRHRDAKKAQRFQTHISKLKLGTHWNRETGAGADVDYFFMGALFAPHLAEALNEIPDLFDSLVFDRFRGRFGRKCAMA